MLFRTLLIICVLYITYGPAVTCAQIDEIEAELKGFGDEPAETPLPKKELPYPEEREILIGELNKEDHPWRPPPYFDLEGQEQGHARVYLKHVLSEPQELPSPYVDAPELEGMMKHLWVNNRPELKANVEAAVLRFEPKSKLVQDGSNTMSELEDEEAGGFERSSGIDYPIEVRVVYTHRGLIVQHSHALITNQRGGVRFSNAPKRGAKQRGTFVEGLNGTGVGIFAAEPREGKRRGVMLCLRDVMKVAYRLEEEDEAREKIELRHSRYELSGASFEVSGRARGYVLSGLGPGLGLAYIQTTRNVVPSAPYYDGDYSMDPQIGLEYHAEKIEPDWSMKGGVVGGGIRSSLMVQTAIGYKRIASHQELMWVRKLRIRQPLKAIIKAGQVMIQPGICHLIYRERKERKVYTREPLFIPEGYLSDQEKTDFKKKQRRKRREATEAATEQRVEDE